MSVSHISIFLSSPDHSNNAIFCYVSGNLGTAFSMTQLSMASPSLSRPRTVLRRAGLEYRGFHFRRLTHASNLIALDINLKLISEQLGYKSIRITIDIYGHLLKKSVERMRNFLEALQDELK